MVKSYKVVVTAKAEIDHRRILTYLAENVSYQTAEMIDLEIIQSIKGLGDRPEKNGLYKINNFPSKIYRRVVIKNTWNLVFQCDEENRIVYILRIFHTKRGNTYIKRSLK